VCSIWRPLAATAGFAPRRCCLGFKQANVVIAQAVRVDDKLGFAGAFLV
jgi:hypothetical protein